MLYWSFLSVFSPIIVEHFVIFCNQFLYGERRSGKINYPCIDDWLDDTANQDDGDPQAPSASNTTPPAETSSPRYFYALGKSLHNQGKDQDALNAFQKIDDSGQLGPFDAQNLHLLKAISHRKLENYTAAAAEYKALLDSLPSNDQLRKTVAWFQQHCAWLARHAKSQQAAQ